MKYFYEKNMQGNSAGIKLKKETLEKIQEIVIVIIMSLLQGENIEIPRTQTKGTI